MSSFVSGKYSETRLHALQSIVEEVDRLLEVPTPGSEGIHCSKGTLRALRKRIRGAIVANDGDNLKWLPAHVLDWSDYTARLFELCVEFDKSS